MRWANHSGHAYTWHPQSGLVLCTDHNLYVASVNAEHPKAVWVGDPLAVRGALKNLDDALDSLDHHLAPYDDQPLLDGVSLIRHPRHRLKVLIDRVMA